MTRPQALAVCAVFVLFTGVAAAKPKVALTPIEGDASGDVHEAVVEALESGKEISLVSNRDVTRAVDKLGDVADFTEKDFKKLATQLEADAIVLGKLEKKGATKSLKFRIYAHKKMAKGFTVSFKDASSAKFKGLLHDKILDKIGVAAGGGDEEEADTTKKKAGSSDDEEDPLASKKGKKTKAGKGKKLASEDDEAKPAKKSDEDEDRPAKKKLASADEGDEDARPAKKKSDEDGEADEEGKSDEAAPRRGKKKVAASDDGELEASASASAGSEAMPRAANTAALRVNLGPSVVVRSYTFNTAIDKPRNVSLSPVPGARVGGEIYPLALNGSTGALANLGIAGVYDRTITLNVSTNGMSAPVKQSHWSVGLRYRLVFGHSETSPTVTIAADYGHRLFSPDRTKLDDTAKAELLADTPTTLYVVVAPGVDIRLPITRSLAFFAGGRGMLVTDAGPIQGLNSYGRAKVYGADAEAGVDIVISKRLAVRVAGEFTQLGYTFTGNGALSRNQDMDDSQQDVGGLADRSIGGSVTLGVMY